MNHQKTLYQNLPPLAEPKQRTETASQNNYTINTKEADNLKTDTAKKAPESQRMNKPLNQIEKKASSKNLLASIKKNITNKEGNLDDGATLIKKEGYTQDLMLVKRIIGGLVHTIDDRYVKILEIKPVNYKNMNNAKKNGIIYSFERIIHSGPSVVQMQIISQKRDVTDYILNIHKQRAKETSKNVINQSKILERHTNEITNTQSNDKRYFFIYEYDGDIETHKRSNKITEIYESMKNMEYYIRSEFLKTGNDVSEPNYEEENQVVGEILYNFYNRKTNNKESFSERVLRINSDVEKYNGKNDPEATVSDYLAPKGFKNISSDMALMDGIYYTFLFVKGDSHPCEVRGGWMDNFITKPNVDTNIYVRRLDSLKETERLGRTIRWKTVRANDKEGNAQDELLEERDSAEYMLKRINKTGQNLYDVAIMFTIHAPSVKILKSIKHILLKELRKHQMQAETCSMWQLKGLTMSAPLCFMDKELFERNSRNYLTDSVASLYPYIGCDLYDPRGWLLGNTEDGSLIVLNNFNTQMFSNANISIFGTSGAGKTCTELTIGNRTRLNGIRTIYIYPEKAAEAQKACNALDGSYIQMHPGSKDCINIMGIRPRAELPDEYKENFSFRQVSLLAEQTSFLKELTELLMPKDRKLTFEEEAELDIAITTVYERIGITDDNDSIYIPGTKKLKTMPLIEELMFEVEKHETIKHLAILYRPFVYGSYKNMNNQTNVDLENEYIVFDCDKTAIGEKMQSVMLKISSHIVYSMMRESRIKNDVLILDEGWRLLEDDESAKQIEELVTLIRGYGGSIIFATQQLGKTINGKNGERGKSIVNNTDIKIILKLKEEEIKLLDGLVELTEEDKNTIISLPKGVGILFYNGSRLPIYIRVSDEELANFTTDANKLREINEKIRMKNATQQ